MKYKFNIISLLIYVMIAISNINAQFSTEAYKQFLSQTENLTSAELLEMHNSGSIC